MFPGLRLDLLARLPRLPPATQPSKSPARPRSALLRLPSSFGLQSALLPPPPVCLPPCPVPREISFPYRSVEEYSWIGYRLQTLGLDWHFHSSCLISKPRPVLDSSPKTTRGMHFRFFQKISNELVWPFWAFLAILVPKSIVVQLYQSFSEFAYYVCKTSLCLRVFCFCRGFTRLYYVCSFRLYVVFQLISAGMVFEQRHNIYLTGLSKH